MYDDIMMAVIELMQQWTDIPIRRAALPPDNGISFEKATSDTISISFDRSTIEAVACVLNAKHSDMALAQRTLDVIHARLTRLASYPKNDRWQIYSIETISGPCEIGREANGQWLIGSSVRIKFYNKESVYNG